MRRWRQRFMNDLSEGVLATLRDLVLTDCSLCLEIREDYVNIYSRGGNLLKPSTGSGGYVAFFDPVYAKGERGALVQALPGASISTGSDVDAWLVRKGLALTKDDCWVFSMWTGYLEESDYLTVRDAFDKAGARFEQIHTSGHASRADLQEFTSSINAKHLVPIHSFEWDQHVDGFEKMTRLHDGEVLDLSKELSIKEIAHTGS